MDTRIKALNGREILDSRGNPTVEVEIELECGIKARASSPSGASTGVHEALELRDGIKTRFGGKGVKGAVNVVNRDLAELLKGMKADDQVAIDEKMISADGTPNKSRFGANSMVAASIAVSRAAARAEGKPLYSYLGGVNAILLPVPMMNVLNGGVHANWQGPDFQEYMIVPYGATDFSESLRWGSEVYQTLKGLLKKEGFGTSVGDEGGFVIDTISNDAPLRILVTAIEKAGYQPGSEIGIALDPAASAFFEGDSYVLRTSASSDNVISGSGGRKYSSSEIIDYYSDLINQYPIISIEDGLAEDDWEGWKQLNDKLGNCVELVGDDIFVTNVERIRRGIVEKTANAVLIKPNQIGTITQTIEAGNLAKSEGWGIEVSHRSGETVDTFISDLAVAMCTGHMKSGAPCRGERIEKYNQLLRIEESLGSLARFAGREAFKR